jgi:hypothetical protein
VETQKITRLVRLMILSSLLSLLTSCGVQKTSPDQESKSIVENGPLVQVSELDKAFLQNRNPDQLKSADSLTLDGTGYLLGKPAIERTLRVGVGGREFDWGIDIERA